jgi:hypothetical protein
MGERAVADALVLRVAGRAPGAGAAVDRLAASVRRDSAVCSDLGAGLWLAGLRSALVRSVAAASHARLAIPAQRRRAAPVGRTAALRAELQASPWYAGARLCAVGCCVAASVRSARIRIRAPIPLPVEPAVVRALRVRCGLVRRRAAARERGNEQPPCSRPRSNHGRHHPWQVQAMVWHTQVVEP